jgi:5-(carboxyamino)imidazole ribonucleotide synthase|tara:strand:+ start:2935 stop:4068 length:1134 start_codon:yes stop_codon:yes gene_type:complete
MLPPGATIGMLGGGQLGRMSLLAGRKLGYHFVVLDPGGQAAPAASVADAVIAAPFDDKAALDELARRTDRITLEFENIPKGTLAHLEQTVAVCPGRSVLEVCQHRLKEKSFLRDNGFPCVPFASISSVDELRAAVAELGFPSVLKTADSGYDGKGQIKLSESTDLADAWTKLGEVPCVLEKWITFENEFSVVCARNTAGEEQAYPVFENEHCNHILDTTIWPARICPDLEAEAQALALAITRELQAVGLITVELFLTQGGKWIVNELAPRPHNSGHVTLDAAVTSQFEQHIRAVAGLPLGAPDALSAAVMVNLLGDRWPAGGQPDWKVLLEEPRAKLHLYGKAEARPGRKMGHFTMLAPELPDALEKAKSLDKSLTL